MIVAMLVLWGFSYLIGRYGIVPVSVNTSAWSGEKQRDSWKGYNRFNIMENGHLNGSLEFRYVFMTLKECVLSHPKSFHIACSRGRFLKTGLFINGLFRKMSLQSRLLLVHIFCWFLKFVTVILCMKYSVTMIWSWPLASVVSIISELYVSSGYVFIVYPPMHELVSKSKLRAVVCANNVPLCCSGAGIGSLLDWKSCYASVRVDFFFWFNFFETATKDTGEEKSVLWVWHIMDCIWDSVHQLLVLE